MSLFHARHERCARAGLLIAVVICLAGAYSCTDCDGPVGVGDGITAEREGGAGTSAGASAKEWTFLLYAAADLPYTYNPLTDFALQVSSGDGVDALCLADTYGETAKIWYIDGDHNAVLREDIGEVNMGSASTLSYFLSYAKTNYPAERYIISFYGHGGGWGGACNDIDPAFDVLRMKDYKQALEGAGGVDLVLFSAPCLMGAFESAYELRGCTDVYIASENLSFYSFWKTVMGSIAGELNSNPDISNLELARSIIDWMAADKKSYARYWGMHYLTMSAVRMDRMSALKDALDDLALGYLADPTRFKTLVESVRRKIVFFDNTSITDLNSVMSLLYREETDREMRAKLEHVMRCLEDAVVSEIHLAKFKNAGGLTIFLPDESTAGILQYYVHDEFGLDFVQDAHWDELLFSIFPASSIARPVRDETVPMLRGRIMSW